MMQREVLMHALTIITLEWWWVQYLLSMCFKWCGCRLADDLQRDSRVLCCCAVGDGGLEIAWQGASLPLLLWIIIIIMDTSTRWQLKYEKLWSRKLQDPINCLAVGKPFLEELIEENDILIGSTAGRILILNQSKVRPHPCMRTHTRSILVSIASWSAHGNQGWLDPGNAFIRSDRPTSSRSGGGGLERRGDHVLASTVSQ